MKIADAQDVETPRTRASSTEEVYSDDGSTKDVLSASDSSSSVGSARPQLLEVRKLDGERLFFESSVHGTIAELRDQVALAWQRPAVQLRLASGGEVLDLSTSLRDFSGIDVVVVSQRPPFDEGEICTVVSIVTVRKTETFTGDVLTELAPGEEVEIIKVGMGRRRRIFCLRRGIEGWISCKTKQNQPLIAKCHEANRLDYFDVGNHLPLQRVAILHDAESIHSPVIAVLSKSARLRVKEKGSACQRNVKVTCDRVTGAEGWLIDPYCETPRGTGANRPLILNWLQCFHVSLCCSDISPHNGCLQAFRGLQQLVRPLPRVQLREVMSAE